MFPIAELNTNIGKLDDDLKKLESQITYLNSVLSSFERQTSGLKDNVETLNGNLSTLTEVLASLTLLVYRVNGVLQILDIPLKILSGFGGTTNRLFGDLLSRAKRLLNQARNLAKRVESLQIPGSL